MDLDPITHLAKLSTAVTARVLRQIADALDAQADTTPPAPVVVHIAHVTVNEAQPQRKLFGRNT
ncbi:hypothetical protein [Rhodococcus daqingensis]|uniref:Uncharacterized protein n=1 Tax=Rhodococcus daqingensis TaxID=2479363 RepID=A0ABW2S3C8_9NOCA